MNHIPTAEVCLRWFCSHSLCSFFRAPTVVCTDRQVPIIQQARFYGTFFKCRSIRHIPDSRALFVQKYPAIWNVPDKFRHTFKLPAGSGSHFMCMRKAQCSPSLVAASQNIYQNKTSALCLYLLSSSRRRLVRLVVRTFCA